jgi:cytochrome c
MFDRRTMNTAQAGVIATLCWFVVAPSAAQTAGDVAAGRAIAQTHCARCHAIGRNGPSPLPIAPPFRELHTRYPVESLQEALAEGVVTGHPDMPEFSFAPEEIDSLIAFLKSLE